MIYRLKKDIIWAKAWMIFDHKYTPDMRWVSLVEWESLGNVQDLIRAIWIDNTEYFEMVLDKEYFEKHIFRRGDHIMIKWTKSLISYGNWDLYFFTIDTHDTSTFIDPISFRLWEMEDLNVGDVFIRKSDVEYKDVWNFCIYLWKQNSWRYMCSSLGNSDWVEFIGNSSFSCESNWPIYIFNRA